MRILIKIGCLFLIVTLGCFLWINYSNLALEAKEFHRVYYKTIAGNMPYIHQIEDGKPYGMNGALSASPSCCLMISAYYGNLIRKTDKPDPSGYGSYLCTPYEMKTYIFKDETPDAEGNNFAGAHGFLIKNKKRNPSPESVSAFLRAHNVLANYFQPTDDQEKTFRWIQGEINANHPVYMQSEKVILVVIGYGTSPEEKDILLIVDPSNAGKKWIYLHQLPLEFLLGTKSISFADPIRVMVPELEIKEKPSLDSRTREIHKIGSTGTVMLHKDYADLWINEANENSLFSWYFVQWDSGSSGWVCSGKGCSSYFEPFERIKEDPEKNLVTLTLILHDSSESGPLLSKVKVIGTDGLNRTLQQTTNNLGQAILKGEKGKWTCKLSKENYYDKTWKESITQTETKHLFLLKKNKQGEDQQKPDLICKEIRMPGSIASEGKSFYINPTIVNVGKIHTEIRSHVKVLLSPNNDMDLSDDVLLGEAEVSALKIDEKCIATIYYNQFPSIPIHMGSEFKMWPIIIVDSRNEIEESNENNTFKAGSPITIKRKPRQGDKSPCNQAPQSPPKLISPLDLVVQNRITFTWSETECASFYAISILREDGSLYFGDDPISGTAYTLELSLNPGEIYYWKITPGNQHGWGPCSVVGRFQVK